MSDNCEEYKNKIKLLEEEIIMLKDKISRLEIHLKKYTNPERNKKYNEKNAESNNNKTKEYLKKLKKTNPEKIKEYARKTYLNRKEKLKKEREEKKK
jgi:type II secretory pathway component PulC